ncbi:hypothetical protein Q5752_003408 [Cryptotrichosporon argae]
MPPPSRQDLWLSGKDETVEVNQRALIDIFRELLQNADDAGAGHVQVKFYSQAGVDALEAGREPSALPSIKADPMVRYVVCNDGIPFRGEDWMRLKKIAEGNPDEEKIGAFGVGFYSLWSVCDDPFVESGGKWMGFYWKDGKDQLLARSGDLPPAEDEARTAASEAGKPWTTFTMALRSPMPLDGPLDFARFLVTSLTFMRTIRRIDMLVDDAEVLQVRKDVKAKSRVIVPGIKDTSLAGMMKVAGVDATGMVITARVMEWLSASGFTPPPLPLASSRPIKSSGIASFLGSTFFNRGSPAPTPREPPPPPPPKDPQEIAILSREIEIYQADVKVTVSPAFGRELERATKKPPPSRMPASLVFSRGDDDAGERDVGAVFSGLCPALDSERSAKVFIGQATAQTTGIGGHLAARFIPTVERESIDLVDRHISHWNRELLWVGGYLSRVIYELELAVIRKAWDATTATDDGRAAREKLLARGLHALRFFSFRQTTPSAVVGQEMESAFFQCANNNAAFPIVSTAGILPIKQVRNPSPEIEKFLPDLPVLTPSTITDAKRPLARLRERGLLRDITFDDVTAHLAARPLNEREMAACLQWWQSMGTVEGYGYQIREKMKDAAVLVTDDNKVVPLSVIQTYIKPQSSSIPTDSPLPPHALPYALTKDLKGATIYPVFGWTELTLVQYVSFLISPPMSGPDAAPDTDIRASPAFAEKVLQTLGRAWQSVSANQQSAIALELKDIACIPTKAGFKKPGEAYFEKNMLFDDLPTIALPKTTAIRGGLEKMLLAIGVRRTVDLQLVFSRLIGGGEWTCADLMKYLVSVRDTLSTEELARLRQTAAFPLERPKPPAGEAKTVVRKKPHELYEPVQAMRELGLPVLEWSGKWKSASDEAKMLFSLGLRRFPPIDTLLGIAATKDRNVVALNYVLAHTSTHYIDFDPMAFHAVAFLPAKSAMGETILAKPGQVFTNPAAKVLGFAVADDLIAGPENAAKLRIPTDPPMEQLVAALVNAPEADVTKAREIFEYLATRLASAPSSSLSPLVAKAFIPVESDGAVRRYLPAEVYFSSKNESHELFRSAFTFVDFGHRANLFLRSCGVRSEPSVKDIAALLMRDPGHMLKQAGSPDKYLEQLRILAANWSAFDAATKSAMGGAPFLLASQLVPAKRKKGGEEEHTREWVLARASEIAVIDNITILQYFGTYILAAPEEHLLEQFYASLGARHLNTLVHADHITYNPLPRGSDAAAKLRRHVLDRVTIFLSEPRRRGGDYGAEWLARPGNFEVAEVGELKCRWTLRQGKVERQHLETLYAYATPDKSKKITLTVSASAQPDDYDIAQSLSTLLLKSPKADDALLLYSILTTPLMALKKRGFNVDRILNQQREEKERFRNKEQEERERHKAAGEATLASLADARAEDRERRLSTATTASSATSAAGTTRSLFDKLRPKRRQSKDGLTASPLPVPGAFPGAASGGGDFDSLGLGPSGPAPQGVGPAAGGEVTTKRPTDLQSIRDTVHKAVNASRPNRGMRVEDRLRAVRDVSESQGAYCDVQQGANIIMALDQGPAKCKIWVPADVPMLERAAYVANRRAVSDAFDALVLAPIGAVFNLPRQVLNVFWDHEGPLIAFNKGGTIYCNARYFSEWHFANVINGRRADALISWYMSIAHELAHNLESAHNASHEFYFSSIAEEYMVPFSRLLSAPGDLIDLA